ncbi:MAG: molybdenum cofactor guanylyltransferase [Candidatus Aminicenantes bacterium]|nr:MAG: molybdenum cofactor guanylyltransferase [Candidatus Aminicenantes bacterium]
MKPQQKMSAIILAGGKSVRMKDNKALLPIRGIPLIQRLSQNLENHFQEIIISAQSVELFDFLPYRVVMDEQPDQGPLMGILCGLEASANPINFVIACDIPEINIPFLHRMIAYTNQYEIVVPVSGEDKYEPLFAFYNKSLVPRIKNLLKQQTRKIIKLFPLAQVKYIPLENTGWYYNLNSTEDYQKYIKSFIYQD